MEHQVLIVVLNGDLRAAELVERIEEIRQTPGVLAVRTLDRVVQEATAAEAEVDER